MEKTILKFNPEESGKGIYRPSDPDSEEVVLQYSSRRANPTMCLTQQYKPASTNRLRKNDVESAQPKPEMRMILQFPRDRVNWKNHYELKGVKEYSASALSEIDGAMEEARLLSERRRVAQKAIGRDNLDKLADECAKMPEIIGEEEYLARIQNLEEAS